MHDLDRALWELGESQPELEQEALEMAAESAGWPGRRGSGLTESDETEFASELLEVDSEEELTGWLSRVAGGARDFLNSGTGQALGAMLKGAVKEGLPVIGQKIGEHYGGSGSVWGTVGQQAGKGLSAALFEVPLEGMSGEDQEFETARAVVRFVDAALRCARRSPGDLPPKQAARRAFVLAARRYAPGLVDGGPTAGSDGGRPARSGRWVRRGNEIEILEG